MKLDIYKSSTFSTNFQVNPLYPSPSLSRAGGQGDRLVDPHHNEERQGDRGDPPRLRRLRQHGSRGRHRVRVHARGQEGHQARPDPPQREQHHHGE